MSLPFPFQHESETSALLRLYLEWGVDCALEETPLNRFREMPQNLPVSPRIEKASTTVAKPSVAYSNADASHPSRSARGNDGISSPDCTLARTATHTVAPIHVPNARLMLIGETPDADEDRSGVVFAGQGGQLLDQMMHSIDLARSAFSQAPALPWRPPGGRDVSTAEMDFCRPILHEAIAQCRPERLLLLGGTPTRMLLGETAVLSRLRGRWTDARVEGLGTIPVLPMRHPLQIRASAAARRDSWRDLLLLAETLASDIKPDLP